MMIGKFTRTRVLLSAGLLAGLVWTGTLAAFTDTATTDGSFSTGTVEIDVDPATELFVVTNMAPGDVVFAALDVENNGSLDFEYLMDTAVDSDPEGLADELVASVSDAAACADQTDYESGTELASSPLSSLEITASRALATAGSEPLCFRVELPLAVDDNGLQGQTAEVTFTFTATQS